MFFFKGRYLICDESRIKHNYNNKQVLILGTNYCFYTFSVIIAKRCKSDIVCMIKPLSVFPALNINFVYKNLLSIFCFLYVHNIVKMVIVMSSRFTKIHKYVYGFRVVVALFHTVVVHYQRFGRLFTYFIIVVNNIFKQKKINFLVKNKKYIFVSVHQSLKM